MSKFSNTAHGPIKMEIYGRILGILFKIQSSRLLAIKLSEVFKHRENCEAMAASNSKLSSRTKFFVHSREGVWREMRVYVESGAVFFEFGVAHGYLTNWWLERSSDPFIEWHGYDTFEGLPETFRTNPSGAFSNDGVPPQIKDERISWHIGTVEQQIESSRLLLMTQKQKVFLFDLDLFLPSLHVWKVIEEHIRVGDLVYFDEAFDEAELRLINEYVLSSRRWAILSSSWASLALLAQ
jgi:hypothetical protein